MQNPLERFGVSKLWTQSYPQIHIPLSQDSNISTQEHLSIARNRLGNPFSLEEAQFVNPENHSSANNFFSNKTGFNTASLAYPQIVPREPVFFSTTGTTIQEETSPIKEFALVACIAFAGIFLIKLVKEDD